MSGDPLRIAWIIYGSLDQVSGGYIYDRLVIEQLRLLGDEVTVVSLDPTALAPPELDTAAYDAVVGDELCFRQLVTLLPTIPARVCRALLVHHLTAWELSPGAERDATLVVERRALDAADVCIATSRATADRLESEQLSRKVQVAEPGADRFVRTNAAGQEPGGAQLRLLFVGNVLPRKRVLELVQAFGELPGTNAELWLVGAELQPDYASRVRAAILEAQLGPRVRWLGALSADGVSEQLALADALVLPSTLEGYGMVLSEALWCGVPIIAARVGAAEDLVSLTSAGLLFEPEEPGGLGAALTTFVADPRLRARLRSAAADAAERLPRWCDTARVIRATLLRAR